VLAVNVLGALGRRHATILLAGAFLLATPLARAQQEVRDAVFKLSATDPEASVPTPEQANKQPLGMGYFLMDLADAADESVRRGDHAAAVKFYRAMAKAVPERSISYSKQCVEYEALGERSKALDACWESLGRGGVTLVDYIRFVELVLAGPGALAQEQIARVDAALVHLGHEAQGDRQLGIATSQLACQVGVRLEDVRRMEACTGKLGQLAPRDPKTLTFRWTLAILHQDASEAEKVIAEAKQAKVPATVLARMNNGLTTLRGPVLRRQLETRIVPAAGALALVAALVWLLTRRRERRLA
jgi:hypothetical protein